MSRPMAIEFSINAPDQSISRRVAELVAAHGYEPKIYFDDESDIWSVYCSRLMLATYEGVVSAQDELNELISRFGANCDGWGMPGNVQK